MVYGTRCHECGHASERPASFLELEVSLTVRSFFSLAFRKALNAVELS